MEDAGKWNTDITSEFIVSMCQLLPKFCGVASDLKHNPIASSKNSFTTYPVACGSSEEFFIRPLNLCVDDFDEMNLITWVLASVTEIPALPTDVRLLHETIHCCKIESCLKYPGFVRLRVYGLLNYNWKYKKYEFDDLATPHNYFKIETVALETELGPSCISSTMVTNTMRGPALMRKSKSNNTCPTDDTVNSVWCPQWPREANDWGKRHRCHGWPTVAKISEVIRNGCHIVYVQHRSCRNDKLQWRLSFSVAEVILLRSWTQIQQIVYHLLRFFAKRELIENDCPKENEVLCTYHLKTLMLWTCEEMSPEWWSSASVITICCDLLERL